MRWGGLWKLSAFSAQLFHKPKITLTNEIYSLKIGFKEKSKAYILHMCKENQVNKDLTGQMKHLRAEQASLLSAGSQLESEIQKLQPKLQI